MKMRDVKVDGGGGIVHHSAEFDKLRTNVGTHGLQTFYNSASQATSFY